MTEIQILFFCGLAAVFIGVMFVLLWYVYKVKMDMANLRKEHEAEMQKMKDLCNKIYDKLKEVVDKVNPLLANTTSSPTENTEVFEAEYVPADEDDCAVIV